jgi:hypothetical protein
MHKWRFTPRLGFTLETLPPCGRKVPELHFRYCRDRGWSMLIDGNSFGISHPCIVRRIATVHRSCLGRSKGQPSATMIGIDGALGKSSPFQVHRSFAMLVSRLINHQGDSLADSRWSLVRCDAGYSSIDAIWCCSGVRKRWCSGVRKRWCSNEKLQVSRGQLSSVTGLLSPNGE